MQLKNKIVLITGGAVRVGRAISLELSKAGAVIFCQYHSSSDSAQSLKDEIEREGGRIQIFQSDLSIIKNIDHTVKAAVDAFGRIDVLVNNAALFYKTPLGEAKEKDWNTLHNLNLKAPFFLSQAVSRHMLKQKSGKIINIGDAGAETPFPAYLPYSITKAGIINMTKGLAKALAPHIQVNCINPGPVMFPEDYSREDKEYSINQTLLKREGSAEDIAATVRFLLEGSDFITGAIIPVDGGRQVR
ncbi:MAG: SDR family oxidoreductase [Calditrichaceae bacterium]